ncbi:MAG: hypothetical protein HY007_00635 [Candidatus Sungbacteria bacterium]|nr:hypothetical protein [Candidatus Sungbacteria bacterium]
MTKNAKNKYLSRFAELAKLGEIVFHSDDLANLWHITNKNTLYTTLKRYIEQGLLFRIYKGFYSIKPPAKIDPLLLGTKALHGYSYVSAESILAEAGMIQQEVPAVTLISGKTKKFSIADRRYYCRKLADKFLYQQNGIIMAENGVRKATRERAMADLLYFNPHAYVDASSAVDWKKVRILQKELGYRFTSKHYG